MNFKFDIVIYVLIICLIASFSLVSANDVSTADDNCTSFNEDEISVYCNGSMDDNSLLSVEGDEILSEGEASFSDLNEKIKDGGSVELRGNYKYDDNVDSPNGIIISKNLILDGKNYTIDANGKARVFIISDGVDVKLKNVNFVNAYCSDNGAVIKNNGRLTIEDCTFTDNSNHMGETIYSGGVIYSAGSILSVVDSKFISNKAAYGGAIYSSTNNTLISNCNFTGNYAYSKGGGCLSG